MAGPWERYSAAADDTPATDGPWSKFSSSAVAAPKFEGSAGQQELQAALNARAGTMTPESVDNPAAAGAPRGAGILDKIDAGIRGIADTATFGMADEIAAKMGALTGLGGRRGEYDANLRQQRGIDKFDEQNNFGPRLGGQLAGAVALPVGTGGAGLLAQSGRGLATGAAMGGAYGFGSGEGIDDRMSRAASGAAFGGLVGGAAPAVIQGIGAVARPIGAAINTARGAVAPDAEAARRVTSALARDARTGSNALDDAGFLQIRSRGQPVVVGDMGGEATRALARSSANTSQEARQALTDVTSGRFEGQAPRVADLVLDLGGGNKALDTIEALKAEAARANRPAYAKAYSQGANGVWDDQLAQLAEAPAVAEAIKQAGKTGANKAVADGFKPPVNPFTVDDLGNVSLTVAKDGSKAIPSLQFWDHVKRNLDDKIGAAKRAGENNAATDLTALKSALVNKLDEAAPAYKDARSGAAAFFGAEDALDAGRKFVTAGRKNDEYARVIGKMSPAERKLFASGFASEMSDKIAEVGDRRSVLNTIFQSPAARQRVQMALGPEKAKELEAFLRVEGVMDRLRTAVQGNSTTARQLVEMGLAGSVGGGAGYAAGGDLKSVSVGAIIGGLARRGQLKIDERVARRVGEMLSSSDPAVIKKLAQSAAKNPGMMGAIRQIEAAVARIQAPLAPIDAFRGSTRQIGGPLPIAADEQQQQQPR